MEDAFEPIAHCEKNDDPDILTRPGPDATGQQFLWQRMTPVVYGLCKLFGGGD
jgi:hypothetical protein